MKIIEINISDLIPYVNNPRDNDGAVDRVASSIQEFGFKQPILIDKEKVIITGHTRLLAAKKLGLNKVPVIIINDLSPAQVKALRIADNRVSQFSTWKKDLLGIEIEALKELDFEIDLTGFTDDELQTMLSHPEFDAVASDETDRLDEMKKVICPKCHHEFEP